MLSELRQKVKRRNDMPLVEMRDALQRAAAILCSSSHPHPSIPHHLVSLPFEIFSEESINMGISLWMGTIHENPRVEPMVLVEVLSAWERTIERKQGLFDPSFE